MKPSGFGLSKLIKPGAAKKLTFSSEFEVCFIVWGN